MVHVIVIQLVAVSKRGQSGIMAYNSNGTQLLNPSMLTILHYRGAAEVVLPPEGGMFVLFARGRAQAKVVAYSALMWLCTMIIAR
jgi:hypothetical protein